MKFFTNHHCKPLAVSSVIVKIPKLKLMNDKIKLMRTLESKTNIVKINNYGISTGILPVFYYITEELSCTLKLLFN